MGFAALGLQQPLIDAVTERGYSEPTPVQQAAIPAILAGQDVMAGAQTGTGKTAAFALPILQRLALSPVAGKADRPLRALVLTPTRELAQQVFQSFGHYGRHSELRTALVYGGASIDSQINLLNEGVDILVATPGRLLDLINRGVADLTRVQHLVFDEADRMLDMGFIDEIRQLLKPIPRLRQTLLFSATFDQGIFDLSKTLLQSPTLIEVDSRNSVAIQVEQRVYAVDVERKPALVAQLIGSGNWQQVLIFTRTKQSADRLANDLGKAGLQARAIHSDKSQAAREGALEDFRQGKLQALVGTDVAARGLDIDQLKYVINYELPFNAEDYIHRIGRTGRAGGSGLAVSLLSAEEEYLLEEIETLLDTRLAQQWMAGFEPDLTREAKPARKLGRGGQKKRARERALGIKPAKKRR